MNDGSLLEKVVGHMEEKLTGNELEMLYAAADYRRAEIVINQYGNDSNLLIVFYVQIVPDDFVMQLHRF
ncbi:Hha/YmoA family nucleoid-associated regulatory protein [Klebsiella pneumoniae]